MRILTFIIGITFLTLSSCSTINSIPKTEEETLTGEWILQNENNDQVGINNQVVTLSFDVDQKDINGFSGCNNYTGDYSDVENTVQFNDIMSTKRACPDLNIENYYFDLLGKVNNYQVKGNNLYLYKDKILLLHFRK